MISLEKTLTTALAALLLGLLLSFAGPADARTAGRDGNAVARDRRVEIERPRDITQNYDARRNMELNDQRVPLETVIARIQSTCPGRLINARHDASRNRYIVRWETSRQQIVSIQADAASGRILSTGGC